MSLTTGKNASAIAIFVEDTTPHMNSIDSPQIIPLPNASGQDRLVSIVIPVFNRPDLLRGVLDGLVNQLLPVNCMEVLVCDDGSTEDLSKVIAEFQERLPGLQHLRQENRGPAAARNLGTRHAGADVVLYLDSDVLPDSDLVEKLLTALNENSSWVGAEAGVEPVDGEANVLWDAPVCRNGGVYLTAAIAYRKAVLNTVGGFDENFRRAACEDVDLAARILPHGEIGFVRDAQVRHPRRRKTFSMFWKKRADWRYVLYLAQRHGFVGWPGNTTQQPRLRVLWCALVTQPAGRLIHALRFASRSPRQGLAAIGHAVFSTFCGLAAVPEILTATCPHQENHLLPAESQQQPTSRVA